MNRQYHPLLTALLHVFLAACGTVTAGEGNTWGCGERYRTVAPVAYHLKSWPAEMQKGVNIHDDYNTVEGALLSREDIRHLSDNWKIRFVRLNLFGANGYPRDYGGPSGNPALETYLPRVDSLLAWCGEFGISVLLNLHVAPGDTVVPAIINKSQRIWQEPGLQLDLINIWHALAGRYKDNTTLIGYSLLNEPQMAEQVEGGLSDWTFSAGGLAKRITDKIREVDTVHTIIVGGVNWSSYSGIGCMVPTGDANTIYSIHNYEPFKISYQGLEGNPSGIGYPGMLDGEYVDKNTLAALFTEAKAFQDYHHLPRIFVGEFSIVSWAPDTAGYHYLKDLIELFNENGWDWAYYVYNTEWPGFNADYVCPDSTAAGCTQAGTDRLALLLSQFDPSSSAGSGVPADEGIVKIRLSGSRLMFSVLSEEDFFVKLEISDAAGRLVREFSSAQETRFLSWDVSRIPEGIYFYRVVMGRARIAGRMLLGI